MSMVEHIRNFMMQCPFLASGPVGVDYLGSTPRQYSIDQTPGTAIIKRYSSGDSIRQALFTFSGREPYGESEEENIDNAAFYEQLAAWLEEQSRAGILPVLDAGKTAQSIEVLTGGYILDADTTTARYQIQCRLNFYQEG